MMGGPVRVRRAPVGVVAAITPWNVPLFIAALKLGPGLLAGCTFVLKPSPETPLDSYLLAEAIIEAGFPEGVINIIPAGRETGEHLVKHPDIDKVSFTGSTAAGMRIGELCGGQLKRCTLELGGKSAAIVLDDANLDDAMLDQLVQSGVMNNGQVCGAQSRILVSRKRYAEVVDALGTALGALKVGDPLDDATQIGPLVAERQRTRVMGYIDAGKAAGARVVTGGGRPADLHRGWYVEPTVFADVDNSMKIAQEEIFGPVLSVIPYDDEDNAVKIANDSDYGLCGSVWTSDPAARRADRGAHAYRCGRDQLVDDPRLQQPVRRVQEVGHRPRARPRRHRPLHRAPDDRPPRGLTPSANRRTKSAAVRLYDAGSCLGHTAMRGVSGESDS